jgi:glycosyltransferase involved in cell wall biosynthesis
MDSNGAQPGMFSRVYLFLQSKKRKRIKHPLSDSLMALLRHETQALIDEKPDFLNTLGKTAQKEWDREQQWFQFVNTVSGRVLIHFGNHLLDHLSGANVFSLFHTLGSTSGLAALLAPYFVAFSQFSNGRELGAEVARRWGPAAEPPQKPARTANVAHFTDTFHEVNGVALTLQQQVRLAVKNGYRYTLITCDDQPHAAEKGVRHFAPISTYSLPEYEQQKLFYPPVLEMLDYCHQQKFTHIHSATPGPIGLAALLTARLLQLPISGTYHTAIPQYVQILTGSDFMAELAWKFVLWYYDQMDQIYAPSQSTKDELVAKGLAADKIEVYPRGIDTDRFHPRQRNGFYKKWPCDEKAVKLLYVGRVSKEKNLHLLLDAYRRLAACGLPTLLVIVGEGPYLDEMRRAADDLPCLFTGRLEGDNLAQAYASSDIFVFPSTTDTFGNVVLEAQASGLPAIVTDQGGPSENVTPGKTGLVVKGESAGALFNAMQTLVLNADQRAAMGNAAHAAMADRSFEAAFSRTWDLFETTQPKKPAMAR